MLSFVLLDLPQKPTKNPYALPKFTQTHQSLRSGGYIKLVAAVGFESTLPKRLVFEIFDKIEGLALHKFEVRIL